MEFEKRTDDAGESVACDSCQYPGRLAMFPKTMVSKELHGAAYKDMWLCEVCAKTHLSVAAKFPRQCSDPRLYQSIAQLGNLLLDAIRGELDNE